MPYFAYTVLTITQGSPQRINESSGILEAPSLRHAVSQLEQSGFSVRDIRDARPEDIQLDNFKKMQRKLRGEPTELPLPDVSERISQPTISDRKPLWERILQWLIS